MSTDTPHNHGDAGDRASRQVVPMFSRADVIEGARARCRRLCTRLGTTATAIVLLSTTAAAQKSAGELGIMQLLLRIQELVRNVAYILGPTLVLLGAILYLFSTRNRQRSARGKRMAYGGVALFAIGLSVDLLLNLIAWVVNV
jgi:hypothetical protein